MARNEQLIRQHKILQILERVRFGKTLEEIQADIIDELGLSSLSTRTVRRDLEALQAAGIDVDVSDSPRGKVWKLGPLAKTATKISFTSTELIALSLGRQLMHPLAGTPFWMGIESFWKKIQAEVPDSVMAHYEKFRKTLRVLGIPAKDYTKHLGIIKTLNRCIADHRVAEVNYQSIGNPMKVRQLEPYTVVLFQSSLYIIAAACEDTNPESRVRSWKLDRFSKATATDKYFQVPDDLDLDQFIGSTMQMFVRQKAQSNYKILIKGDAAPWVLEDPIHADQKIKKLPDGNIELTVPAVHDMEIIPRVLSLGDNAEILAPKAARKLMAQIVTTMAEKYNE
jgi:predicted DNA-binding transcriptional regulator YafY